jgi:hypothetical protein
MRSEQRRKRCESDPINFGQLALGPAQNLDRVSRSACPCSLAPTERVAACRAHEISIYSKILASKLEYHEKSQRSETATNPQDPHR